jgi:hypothetical protein
MIPIRLSTMGTLEIPSPHPINQLKPNIGQRENNNSRDSRCDKRVNIHDEDKVVKVNQFSGPPTRREGDVDGGVDTVWRAYAILRN